MTIKTLLIIITDTLTGCVPCYQMPIDRDEMEIMVHLGFFPSIRPIWDFEALLRNLRGTDPCAQASSTCLWICHNCWLIYAVSWTQLFPMSTVVKMPWDTGSFKTDWMPLLVFIWGACRQCVDWRWAFGPRLGGRGLLCFENPASPYVSPTTSSFSTLFCAISLIRLRNEPIGRSHPLLFDSLTPPFQISSLLSHLHYFLLLFPSLCPPRGPSTSTPWIPWLAR